jgi:DNA-3-methyladenine glycosylase
LGLIPQATPIATNPSQHLPQSFFARPAEQVAPELIGCLLVKRQPTGELLWGVIVETEAYSQDDPACHGYRRRTPSNETCLEKLVVGRLVKDVNNISICVL